MEPRPPRTRPAGPTDRTSRTPEGARPTTALYPGAQTETTTYGPGGQPGYAGAPPVATEIPLLPRQQRRRRRLIQTALAGLLVLGGIGGAGYYLLEDRLTDDDDPTPQAIAASSPAAVATAFPSGTTAPTAAAPTDPPSGGVAAPATATVPAADPTAASAAPTEPPARASRPAVRRTAEPTPDPEDAAEPPPLEELLPTAADVPSDLTEIEDGTRTEEEVAANLGTDDAAERLTAYGWQANLVRNFVAADPSVLPADSTSAVSVSVHRFADAESAAEALTYFSDRVVATLGFEEFDIGALGESRRGLQGVNGEGVAEAIAYVQAGTDLFRIGGIATTAEGDPSIDVLEVAEAVVAA